LEIFELQPSCLAALVGRQVNVAQRGSDGPQIAYGVQPSLVLTRLEAK
jgi:hypothetical protein